MWIDSHCHLNLLDLSLYQQDVSVPIQAAREASVTTFLCVGTTLATSRDAVVIAEKFEDIYASVGVHPSEALESDELTHEVSDVSLAELACHPRVVAIGETGLDYHYNSEYLARMRERFRRHIRAAHLAQKPLIIHTRAAVADTLQIMQEEKAERFGGVMHCFTEDWAMAEAALAMGFYISFSGIITFKNAVNVAEVAARVPLDRLLVETDAPYLAPVPHRGKPNEPKYLPAVGARLAELKGVSVAEIARHTSENFRRCFGLL